MCVCRQCAQSAHKLKLVGGMEGLGLPRNTLLQQLPRQKAACCSFEAFVPSPISQLPRSAQDPRNQRESLGISLPASAHGWPMGPTPFELGLQKRTCYTTLVQMATFELGMRKCAWTTLVLETGDLRARAAEVYFVLYLVLLLLKSCDFRARTVLCVHLHFP